jgi:hypothetical protein
MASGQDLACCQKLHGQQALSLQRCKKLKKVINESGRA